MNKNQKTGKASTGIAILVLCMVGTLFCVLVYPDKMLMIYFLSLIFVACLALLINSVIVYFIVPHFKLRKTALAALGKEGIRIMRHDENARLVYKGIYALLNGKVLKAEDYLQESLAKSEIRQNQLFCVEWLIHLYESTDNNAKLMWCYRKSVELAPENAELQSRLGHAYFNIGALEKAEYHFEQALRYDANNGYAYFSLSKIYLIRNDMEKASDVLQKLQKVNEQHPLCHAALADYYAMLGDKGKAEEECKKAVLCGINEPDALNKRINAMLSFHCTDYSGDDLPALYYRRIVKPEDQNASSDECKTEE